jgi:hypothetical protein
MIAKLICIIFGHKHYLEKDQLCGITIMSP